MDPIRKTDDLVSDAARISAKLLAGEGDSLELVLVVAKVTRLPEDLLGKERDDGLDGKAMKEAFILLQEDPQWREFVEAAVKRLDLVGLRDRLHRLQVDEDLGEEDVSERVGPDSPVAVVLDLLLAAEIVSVADAMGIRPNVVRIEPSRLGPGGDRTAQDVVYRTINDLADEPNAFRGLGGFSECCLQGGEMPAEATLIGRALRTLENIEGLVEEARQRDKRIDEEIASRTPEETRRLDAKFFKIGWKRLADSMGETQADQLAEFTRVCAGGRYTVEEMRDLLDLVADKSEGGK